MVVPRSGTALAINFDFLFRRFEVLEKVPKEGGSRILAVGWPPLRKGKVTL
jgi:hypothetical protein